MVQKNERVLSLDIMRGLTVMGMILVNNPGDWGKIYAPLRHAEWHGCTPTDLVFPFFLFMVGVSTSFSMLKAKQDPLNHGPLMRKALVRSLKLIGLGLLLTAYPFVTKSEYVLKDFSVMRWPGVLQRIGLVYLCVSWLFIKTGWRMQLGLLVSILLTYWAAMTLIPVPGFGAPDLSGPDTTLAGWLDLQLLEGHMWKATWDPEGLLSTLPAVGTGLLGVLVGTWVKQEKDAKEMVAWLFAAGAMVTFLGDWWDFFFPINKSLWTSSYVLYAGGLGMICLALLYWLVDVKKLGHAQLELPRAFGMNAMAAFFGSGILVKTMMYIPVGETRANSWFYQRFCTSWLGDTPEASLCHALLYIAIMSLPIWYMYRKNIIWKV